MENFGLSKSNYRRKGQFNPTKNHKHNISLREVFNLVTYDIHELISSVRIQTLDKKIGVVRETFDRYKNETEYVEVTTKYQPNLGKCFSFRPRRHVVKLGVSTIDILAKTSIYVYMGYPGQFMFATKTKVA